MVLKRAGRTFKEGMGSDSQQDYFLICMAIRDLHIILEEEMSSSAFINAVRRFVCIQRSANEFCSDRGTSFMEALDALRMDNVCVEQGSVQDFLHKSGTIWKFNPPHASLIGGSWEG